MPNPAVAADLDEALDVKIDLPPQFPFHPMLSIDYLTNAASFSLAEVRDFGIRIDPGLSQDSPAQTWSDAVDMAQSNLDPLAFWKVYPCYPRHLFLLPLSPWLTKQNIYQVLVPKS
jgi:hypothetical protein